MPFNIHGKCGILERLERRSRCCAGRGPDSAERGRYAETSPALDLARLANPARVPDPKGHRVERTRRRDPRRTWRRRGCGRLLIAIVHDPRRLLRQRGCGRLLIATAHEQHGH